MEDLLRDYHIAPSLNSITQNDLAPVNTQARLNVLGSRHEEVLQGEPDDDFGEFVESQSPKLNTHNRLDSPERAVSPARLLHFIEETIMTIPDAFISAMSQAPFSIRQKVLHHKNMKNWLEAMVEGHAVAQRIILGRNRSTMQGASRAECQAATEHISHVWKLLIPRLTSLSSGTLTLTPLQTVAEDSVYDAAKACPVCRTLKPATLFTNTYGSGHRSCLRLIEKHNANHTRSMLE